MGGVHNTHQRHDGPLIFPDRIWIHFLLPSAAVWGRSFPSPRHLSVFCQTPSWACDGLRDGYELKRTIRLPCPLSFSLSARFIQRRGPYQKKWLALISLPFFRLGYVAEWCFSFSYSYVWWLSHFLFRIYYRDDLGNLGSELYIVVLSAPE